MRLADLKNLKHDFFNTEPVKTVSHKHEPDRNIILKHILKVKTVKFTLNYSEAVRNKFRALNPVCPTRFRFAGRLGIS
jgi:hypothetical protein